MKIQGCSLVLHARVTSVALCSRKARTGHCFGQVDHLSIIWFFLSLILSLVRSTTCLGLSCLKNSRNNNNFNTERVDELMINCCLWTRWGTTQPQTFTTNPRVWAQLCYSIDLRFNIQHSSLDKEIATISNQENQTLSLNSILFELITTNSIKVFSCTSFVSHTHE